MHIENCTSSLEMARILVQYMSDAKRVRKELLTRFPTAPSIKTISALRGAWLMGPRRAAKATEHCSAEKENEKMVAHGSNLLLRALWREHPHILRHLNARKAA